MDEMDEMIELYFTVEWILYAFIMYCYAVSY